MVNSLHQMLSGENAFYNQANYLETTAEQLGRSSPPNDLVVTFSSSTSFKHRAIKVVKNCLLLPLLHKLFHRLLGCIILPSESMFRSTSIRKATQRRMRAFNHANFEGQGEAAQARQGDTWKYKRFKVVISGYEIDAMIAGKASTLANGRWVLASPHREGTYEGALPWNASETDRNQLGRMENNEWVPMPRTYGEILGNFLDDINGNVLMFNYPGIGASSGTFPSKETIIKAYRAMLTLLENDDYGIGAKEIIGYGFSIGGGIQGEALKGHHFQTEKINYLFIKDRSFANLADVISHRFTWIAGWIVRRFGFNLNTTTSSNELSQRNIHEIILQAEEDDIVPAAVSQTTILQSKEATKHKTFLAFEGEHDGRHLETVRNNLATIVNAQLTN